MACSLVVLKLTPAPAHQRHAFVIIDPQCLHLVMNAESRSTPRMCDPASGYRFFGRLVPTYNAAMHVKLLLPLLLCGACASPPEPPVAADVNAIPSTCHMVVKVTGMH